VRILEVERETWRQVCEQMPEAPQRLDVDEHGPKEITSNSAAISPVTSPGGAAPAPGGFSLDA
jgi:hypothetical protein